MFGGLSFMVNDKMIVNVRRGGDLLVRVDPIRSPELVADHGARFAEMGAGRAMGPGWIDVPAETICLHGDAPGVISNARAVREALDSVSVDVRRFDAP